MTPRITSALHTTKFGDDGKPAKFVHIVYMVGDFGPFWADVPDSDHWQLDAQRVINAQALSLQAIGAQ